MLKLPLKLALLLLAVVSGGVLWQQGQLAVLALSRIDPVPETREMVAAGHYAEAAGYLDFFMEYDYVNQDPAAQALHAQIEQELGRVAYQAGKLKEGPPCDLREVSSRLGKSSDLMRRNRLGDQTRGTYRWFAEHCTQETIDAVVVCHSPLAWLVSADPTGQSRRRVHDTATRGQAWHLSERLQHQRSVLHPRPSGPSGSRKAGALSKWLWDQRGLLSGGLTGAAGAPEDRCRLPVPLVNERRLLPVESLTRQPARTTRPL